MPALPVVDSSCALLSRSGWTTSQQTSRKAYQLEYADALSTGAWTSLGVPTPGTGDLLTFTNILPTAPQRFYRLRLLP
jgi:hypothetical protein